MPTKGFTVNCMVADCRAQFRSDSLTRPERCPKCAAYYRGSQSTMAAEHQKEMRRIRGLARQKKRRHEVGVDANEDREIRMRERAGPLSDFLRRNE